MFRVENALRIFVYCVLKNECGSRWQGVEIDTAETKKIAIKNLVARRLQQQDDFHYLGATVSCPMMYLNSGELIHLIFSDAYWPKFARYLKGKKEILRIKLEEIGSIRNSLAHFRPVTADFVAVLKQNAKHVFGGVEDFLSQISSCNRVVPTNTDEDWYRKLSVLGNDLCKLSLYESPNREWVRVQITFETPSIGVRVYSDGDVSQQLLNLNSPALLTEYEAIAEKVINITEYMPIPKLPEDRRPIYRKQVSLLFGASTIRDSHVQIRDALAKFLADLAQESELLVNDHLARGKLLEMSSVFAFQSKDGEKARWNMNEDRLLSPVPESGPPEYWRTVGRWNAAFLDSAQRYPWMPVDISKDDFPF